MVAGGSMGNMQSGADRSGSGKVVGMSKAQQEKQAIYETWLEKSRLPDAPPPVDPEPLVQRMAKMLPVEIADWPDACVQLRKEYPNAEFVILWPRGAVGMLLEVRE
jgi:hypothetical protein